MNINLPIASLVILCLVSIASCLSNDNIILDGEYQHANPATSIDSNSTLVIFKKSAGGKFEIHDRWAIFLNGKFSGFIYENTYKSISVNAIKQHVVIQKAGDTYDVLRFELRMQDPLAKRLILVTESFVSGKVYYVHFQEQIVEGITGIGIYDGVAVPTGTDERQYSLKMIPEEEASTLLVGVRSTVKALIE